MRGPSMPACAASQDVLTDEQWELVGPLIPDPPRRADLRGRPWRDAREVLDGVFWILRHGAHWRDLPECFPPHQTCRRRFRQWLGDGTLRLVLEALEEDLRGRGRLDVVECMLEDAVAEEDREGVGGARGRSSWQRQTARLLLSPATLRLLRRTKSPLARKLSLPPGGVRG